MFRLISTNAQQGFRPVLLSKVRGNKGPLSLTSSTLANTSGNNVNSQHIVTSTQFARSNSNSSNGAIKNTKMKVDSFISKATADPLIKEAIENPELTRKLEHFKDLLYQTYDKGSFSNTQSRSAFNETVNNMFSLFDNEALRSHLSSKDLFQYANALQRAVYFNRTNRLSGNKNRDKDQSSNNYSEELLLKNAVLNLAELIIGNEFQNRLSSNVIKMLFYSMLQFRFYNEMINLWENGINDPINGKLFLQQETLAIVLDVCFENKRFTYEEILQIYELNSKDTQEVADVLLCTIGKIAIVSGDYSRALDSLETLLKMYEGYGAPKARRELLHSLSELHLTFIGECKDFKIAKHFFDKVIEFSLPYSVPLKAPKVVSFIENCYEADEPMETIIDIWKSTLTHYKDSYTRGASMNARYAILNNGFFGVFFKKFPTLNNESFDQLRKIISEYANIKQIDETFLNTIISNYIWQDKEVLDQLIENYSIYDVQRTPVSYRIVLKKLGEIKGYSNKDILDKWYENLTCLDNFGYVYIPVADWAALRDATILSGFSENRIPLYLTVVNTFRNYMQDRRSCLRFLGNWAKMPEYYPLVAQISDAEEDFVDFGCDVEVKIPQLENLTENVSFRYITREITQNRKDSDFDTRSIHYQGPVLYKPRI
ncbi:protein RMD9, mitochondrial [Scheffersomyces amazonensis]|uniref:protein RMD9, mitochondrial n=1 Tax=Scheffersomyces amazonensis TaxID=1078765 RepID=UPI00315D3144